MTVSDSNPYAPPSSKVMHMVRAQPFFLSGLLYAFASWAVYLFSRAAPIFLGGTCSLPYQGLLGVLMLGFVAPAVIGLPFMFWAERRKQPAKRLLGFTAGIVLIPTVLLLNHFKLS